MSSFVTLPSDSSPQHATLQELRQEVTYLVWPALILVGIALTLGAEAFHWRPEASALGAILIVLPLVAWALLADIAAIQRNSQHLASLVDDVFDLSQVEAERMALSSCIQAVSEILSPSVQPGDRGQPEKSAG